MDSLDKLRAAGVPLMTAPRDTYYEMLAERLPGHGEQGASCKRAASCSTAAPKAAPSGCCCKSFRRPSWARCSSSQSSARATKALARATSRRCLSPWSATSCAGASLKGWWRPDSARSCSPWAAACGVLRAGITPSKGACRRLQRGQVVLEIRHVRIHPVGEPTRPGSGRWRQWPAGSAAHG